MCFIKQLSSKNYKGRNMSQGQNRDEKPDHGKSFVHEAEIIDNEPNKSNQYTSDRNYRYQNIGPTFIGYPVNFGGCGPMIITFILFIICLAQYGALAGIGFLVFHIIGSILGSLRATRTMMLGYLWNPWPWRIGNWCVSFLLTVWLAGGFNQ